MPTLTPLRCSTVLLLAAGLPAAASPEGAVVLLFAGNAPAYQEAIAGIREILPEASVMDISQPGEAGRLIASLAQSQPALLITIGLPADRAVQALDFPVLSTMTLEGDAEPRLRRPAGLVTLQLPLAAVLAGARRVWPRASRAGMIRNPARGPAIAELAAEARRRGYTLEVADSSGPERLLEAFLSLQGRADFVWCPPDAALFNATTVPPLLLESLRRRLPVVGFSESFLRAGAAAGVFPDYHAAGLQTGQLALRWLRVRPELPFRESCRSTRVGVNQRVARLLGLPLPNDREGLLVIR